MPGWIATISVISSVRRTRQPLTRLSGSPPNWTAIPPRFFHVLNKPAKEALRFAQIGWYRARPVGQYCKLRDWRRRISRTEPARSVRM